MILLDTDVLVDVLRAHAPALAWLNQLDDSVVGLPGFVAPLATFNARPYRVIRALETRQPYAR